jgi:hypothetical protein
MPDDDGGRAQASGATGTPDGQTGASAPGSMRQEARTTDPDHDAGPTGRDHRAGDLVRLALRCAREDPAGSLLLAVAIGLSGVLVWMLAPLTVVVGGLLCLAAVAVDSRNNR